VRGLLRRTTLTIDGGAGHRLGPTGSENRVAGHVDALLAHLHDAAHDDVVDDARVDAGVALQRLEHLRHEIDRVPVLQLPVTTAEWGSDGIDDHRVVHAVIVVYSPQNRRIDGT